MVIRVILAVLSTFPPLISLADSRPPLRVGFIVPFTGPLGEFGDAIRNGVTLASEEHSSVSNGVRVVYEDSRYDSRTSVANLHKLRTVDRVNVIYVFGGPMTDTLAPIAEHHRVPLISTEYDERYTRRRKFVIRFANNASHYADALLSELRRRGYRRFALVKVENQYHNTLSQAFTARLRSEERAEVIHNVEPGELDFRTAIAALPARSFDALGVYLSPGMQQAFFQQLQSVGQRYPLFGTDSFESRAENLHVERTTNGALFANSAVSGDFSEKYRHRFGSAAQIVHAALAYEFIRLVADRFARHSEPPTPDDFIAHLPHSGARPSVAGEFYFRNTPESGQYFSFAIAIREVQSGEPVILSVHPAP